MKTFKKSLAVILAVLMMLSMMIVGGVSTNAADTVTLYCKCAQAWWKNDGAAVGVHYWGGSSSTTWPGVKGTAVEGETDLWQFEVPADSTGLIFVRMGNSGDQDGKDWGAKTANLSIPTDGSNLYTITSTNPAWGDPGVTGEWSVYSTGIEDTTASTQATTASSEPASEPSSEPASQPSSEPVEKTTVYFVNSGNWDTVNAYVWYKDSEGTTFKPAAWPGTAMTATGEKAGNGADIYSFEFNSEYTLIVFNNGSGAKTLDKTVEGGKYFDYKTDKWYDDPAEIAATGDVVTLAGTMNGWSTSKTPFTDGSVSVDLDANTTYEFKIVVNGSYYGNNGPIYSSITGWTFKSDEGNCKINTALAGTYTFSFDVDTMKLSVEYPTADYTVVYNYVTEDGPQTLTKTDTLSDSDINVIAMYLMPDIKNQMYYYDLGECTADGTTITANLVETKKLYSVTVDGAVMETQFGYKEKATVTLKDGSKYTFYVTGDTEITSDDPKVAAAISLDAVTVTDTKVSMDLLATANVDKFARMGVAFATAEKSVAEISTAVSNVATGTAVFDGIAVHNSTVNAPNESGSYQFTYAPYVSKDKADKTLYFYTFAVDTDGNVSVSSVVSVDLANAVA